MQQTVIQTPLPISTLPASTPSVDGVDAWFGNLIHFLGMKRLQYSTQTLAPEEARSFEAFASGKFTDAWMRETSQAIHRDRVFNMLDRYFSELPESLDVSKIAFEWNGRKVMVWVEIQDGQSSLEDEFYAAEARTNAAFEQYGFSVDTFIVEEQDRCEVPPHYSILTQ